MSREVENNNGEWTEKAVVLIVDDQPANIRMLAEVLSTQYRIKTAANGMTALKAASLEDGPDLILLDIVMPDMDGYEVCRRLKENPETQDIPVIFITALDQLDQESRGLALGAADYITKPFKSDIVLLRVHNHIVLKRQHDLLRRQKRQLEEALTRVRLLSGMLPICSSCKKIRNDEGYWSQIESYIETHSDAEFSHGICPECIKKLYPEIAEEILLRNEKEAHSGEILEQMTPFQLLLEQRWQENMAHSKELNLLLVQLWVPREKRELKEMLVGFLEREGVEAGSSLVDFDRNTFALFLSDTDKMAVLGLASRILDILAPIESQRNGVVRGGCVGIAHLLPSTLFSRKTLVDLAEKALVQAAEAEDFIAYRSTS